MGIIVTGGAGFIGFTVMRKYIQATGHKAINLNAIHAPHQSLITYVADRTGYEVRAERALSPFT